MKINIVLENSQAYHHQIVNIYYWSYDRVGGKY